MEQIIFLFSFFFVLGLLATLMRFQLVGLPRHLKGGSHLGYFLFLYFSFFSFFQPIDHLIDVFNQWANLRCLKGGFHLRFYFFLLVFIFYLFSYPTLLEKKKIIFKCRNTSKGATCITGWKIKWCVGLKPILWHVPEWKRTNSLTLMISITIEEEIIVAN